MIDTFKGASTAIFGAGDICVRTVKVGKHPTLDLLNCSKTKIGDKPETLNRDGEVIRMIFKNEKSLDVVINKLLELKESFSEEKSSKEQSQAW